MLTQFESDRAFYAYNSICIFDLILNLNTSYTWIHLVSTRICFKNILYSPKNVGVIFLIYSVQGWRENAKIEERVFDPLLPVQIIHD